jgi:sirohydrochlorin cobaltochelatase
MCDKIVTDLGRNDDFIALLGESFRDVFLAQAVAVSIGGIEKRHSKIESFVHECDRFAFAEIPPPTRGDRPQTKTDLADCQIGIFVGPETHRRQISPRPFNTQLQPLRASRCGDFSKARPLFHLDVRCRLLNIAAAPMRSDTGLLIVAHGSTVNPDSSAPTWAHAGEIQRRGIFADVQCAFWKEEPSLRDARFLFADNRITRVLVVPNFISEGYFTQTVIPRELELDGAITTRANGQIWHYREPVGNHPMVTELLIGRAREAAPNVEPARSALLIVGHGTELNDNSAVAAKREAERIRARAEYASVLNAYMEEPPLISDWDKLTNAPNVIVVPFFIADGLHSYEDIPVLLGIEKNTSVTSIPHRRSGDVFRHNPHQLRGRFLYYGSAVGTDPRFAEAIIEQALNVSSVAHAD